MHSWVREACPARQVLTSCGADRLTAQIYSCMASPFDTAVICAPCLSFLACFLAFFVSCISMSWVASAKAACSFSASFCLRASFFLPFPVRAPLTSLADSLCF